MPLTLTPGFSNHWTPNSGESVAVRERPWTLWSDLYSENPNPVKGDLTSLWLPCLGCECRWLYFQQIEEKPEGRTITGWPRSESHFLPTASFVVKCRLANRPDFGWMRRLCAWRDCLFFSHGYNYELCCPPKYLPAAGVRQQSLYCYAKVNKTVSWKHQLCDCYFLQAAGCWVLGCQFTFLYICCAGLLSASCIVHFYY